MQAQESLLYLKSQETEIRRPVVTQEELDTSTYVHQSSSRSERTTELNSLYLAPCSLHRWEEVHTEHVTSISNNFFVLFCSTPSSPPVPLIQSGPAVNER